MAGKGYALFWDDGRKTYAHRWAYRYWRGEIPGDLCIDHLCRVKLCVNPWHLECVTMQENVQRGLSPTLTRARAAAITHCPKGHRFTDRNTYRRPGDNARICRTCRNQGARRRRNQRGSHEL